MEARSRIAELKISQRRLAFGSEYVGQHPHRSANQRQLVRRHHRPADIDEKDEIARRFVSLGAGLARQHAAAGLFPAIERLLEIPVCRHTSPTGIPLSTCCSTAVICSTETRFFFTARLLARRAGLCRRTRSQCGPKNPEPLTTKASDDVERGAGTFANAIDTVMNVKDEDGVKTLTSTYTRDPPAKCTEMHIGPRCDLMSAVHFDQWFCKSRMCGKLVGGPEQRQLEPDLGLDRIT